MNRYAAALVVVGAMLVGENGTAQTTKQTKESASAAEAQFRYSIRLYDELADILSAVRDEASAKVALTKIKGVRERVAKEGGQIIFSGAMPDFTTRQQVEEYFKAQQKYQVDLQIALTWYGVQQTRVVKDIPAAKDIPVEVAKIFASLRPAAVSPKADKIVPEK
jgi:hypothetical protein